MSAHPAILLSFLLLMIISRPAFPATPNIIGPEADIVNNNIIVRTSISGTSELEQTLRSGVGKEIIFTAELIRVWKFWPDEFVVSKKIRRTIKYDNLRDHYTAVSFDGITRYERKFNDIRSLAEWAFTADLINLANIRELEPDTYYIRAVVESRSLEQLPLIGFVTHLVPEVEMSLAKESPHFTVGGRK